MSDSTLPNIRLPPHFEYGEVIFAPEPLPEKGDQPPLGVLENFKGTFRGHGFNTIFRPNNTPTATTFAIPVLPPPPAVPNSAVLELNLTHEKLTFSAPLGSVPNRGLDDQKDIFLNGVSYLQTINDVTNSFTGKADGEPTGIHTETGFWLNVPATTSNPVVGDTVVRLGSIPHGTTINAQGAAPVVTPHAPKISPRSITPFVIGDPTNLIVHPNQSAADIKTARLPQDLSLFIKEGTITQEILDNPAAVLTEANDQLNIIETLTFNVATQSKSEPGGGTANIAFLVGQNAQAGPNANAVQMSSTFWIEKVQAEITIHRYTPGHGQNVLILQPDFEPTEGKTPPPLPLFAVTPPGPITKPTTITVHYTQIQYAQDVVLDFKGLSWPHLSVATLVPASPIPVPASAFHHGRSSNPADGQPSDEL